MFATLAVTGLHKSFTIHAQGGLTLPALRDVGFSVAPGECLALVGPSGAGKSTLLRSLYGNYRAQAGSIRVRHGDGWTEMVDAEPRTILDVRRRTIGFVSQFLRVIPRVATLDVVAEPIIRAGQTRSDARSIAESLLDRLRIPARLRALPPATFSGGEQQRVNIARSLGIQYPVLLLDEPTASLDAENRDAVIDLVRERRDAGAAIVAIFHDAGIRDALATRVHHVAHPGVHE